MIRNLKIEISKKKLDTIKSWTANFWPVLILGPQIAVCIQTFHALLRHPTNTSECVSRSYLHSILPGRTVIAIWTLTHIGRIVNAWVSLQMVFRNESGGTYFASKGSAFAMILHVFLQMRFFRRSISARLILATVQVACKSDKAMSNY